MPHSPRSLLVTVYGLYARDHGGALPVSGLIRLAARFGVDAQAVRAAVSRLKRRGLVTPSPVSGTAGYALTDLGHAVLDEGDSRIFHPRRAEPGDGWVLSVFSIPETQRAKRHVLRGRLTWLGFGQTAPGVWIAPAHVMPATRQMLARYGLSDYVNLFRADYFGAKPAAEAVAEWWDLPRIADMYRGFTATHQAAAAAPDPLVSWVNAVTDWRRLPFLDPGLPADCLPDDWPGDTAAALFAELGEQLAAPAADRAGLLLAPGPITPGTRFAAR